MSGKTKTLFLSFIGILFLVIAAFYLHGVNIPVLEPAGPVGGHEKNLLVLTSVISALVVIPVFALAIFIAVRYRAGNPKADYRPDWSGSRRLELTWWAIPSIIIGFLSIVAWNSAHALDPFKSLDSSAKPLNIQVISLDWKWLFIYPDQAIASVNRLDVPVGRPVSFHITSDTVMDSFWVPALGGQIYSMPGMDTQLHLQADKAGDYRGLSANISGVGFSKMDFTVSAVSGAKFASWVSQMKTGGPKLDLAAYAALAKQGTSIPFGHYSKTAPGIYDYVIGKYMAPVVGAGELHHD